MHVIAVLALTTTLVLRTGDRITVTGPVTEQNGMVVFRSGSALYSIAADEVDADATKAANQVAAETAAAPPRKLKVSAEERNRLLRDLEQNHEGVPAQENLAWTRPTLEAAHSEETAHHDEEWNWRHQAQAYEEQVHQAVENLAMLKDKAVQLRDQIRDFLSLGYRPGQFTYQTMQLQVIEDQIPYAELDVKRAERAYDQFRDNARKQGVMPGWLR
jgi:hypothetical protein